MKRKYIFFLYYFFILIVFLQCTSERNNIVCYARIDRTNIVFFSSYGKEICVKIGQNNFCGQKEVSINQIGLAGNVNYKIYRGEEKICEGYFKNPMTMTLKFAVIGDTSYKTGYLPLLIQKIQEFSPNIVFHVGDFQYDTHMDKWSRLFEYLKPIFSTSLFQLVAGNHEYDSWEDRENFKRFFPYEGEFFFEWNGINFLGINTFKPNWYEDFLKVFEGVEKSEKPLIIFIHKPFVSLSRWSQISTMNEEVFRRVYDKVSLIFSGHDHIYGRVRITFPNRVVENIISGGGGAYIYGCPNSKSKNINISGIPEFRAEVVKCIPDFNITLCELSSNSIRCKSLSPKRGILDDFSIDLFGMKH